MSNKSENKNQVMTVGSLNRLLAELEVQDDFEIWLSSDEEGNEFLPMLANPELSLAVDKTKRKVTFFPLHR